MNEKRSAQIRLRAAFTLPELLLVLGLIAVLIAIATPIAAKAYRNAARARIKSDLSTIGAALEAYKLDHRDYPRSDLLGPINGSVLLCWALIAPGPATAPDASTVGDGADGPGFRTRGTQGQVYGPYIQPDRFKLVDLKTGTRPVAFSDDATAIVDRYGNAIYYCPQTRNVLPNAPVFADGPTPPTVSNTPVPMYDHRYFVYNDPIIDADPQRVLSLGDGQNILGSNVPGPFLLWSAGPNGFFGHDPNTDATLRIQISDDVTNFRN